MKINPPYTYNDYRYTYNQACFYYNGGFDLECLAGTLPRRGGARASKSKIYPQMQVMEILFKTDLYFINDEKLDNDYVVKKYNFKENKNVRMIVKEMDLKQKKPILISESFSLKTLKNRMKVKVDCLGESKTKYRVTGCLFTKRPLKIKLNSPIFKMEHNNGNKDK